MLLPASVYASYARLGLLAGAANGDSFHAFGHYDHNTRASDQAAVDKCCTIRSLQLWPGWLCHTSLWWGLDSKSTSGILWDSSIVIGVLRVTAILRTCWDLYFGGSAVGC